MALKDTLARFHEQFDWQPEVANADRLTAHTRAIVYGMGGSHLGAWLIKQYGGLRDVYIHRNYGFADEFSFAPDTETFHILSSYSGTTEEVLNAAQELIAAGNPRVAVVTTGGSLLALAKDAGWPYIQIPETGLEPRMAIGFSLIAIARLLGYASLEAAVRAGGKATDPRAGEAEGSRIGALLEGKIPLVWASAANLSLAFIWKIKFNETAKIPAFCNAMPELCHNELTGFDVVDATRAVSAPLAIIMLEDVQDHPRIQKRMEIARDMLGERGIHVERVALSGDGFGKAFENALLADWVSLHLAEHYGVPNPETPLIAEFKKRMAQ